MLTIWNLTWILSVALCFFFRSSVRLRSIGSGHGELNLVISELKEMRANAKAFLNAQHTASMELLQWAHAGENRAIQDTFTFLNELSLLWTDTQKDFVGKFSAAICHPGIL